MIQAIDTALWTLIAFLAVWQMWIGYVAVMHLRRVRERWGLTLTQKIFGYPAVAVYYLLDLILRLTVFLPMDYPKYRWGEIFGVRLPYPETVSRMLERKAREGEGWRRKASIWIREDLLADFDPTGGHGKPGR